MTKLGFPGIEGAVDNNKHKKEDKQVEAFSIPNQSLTQNNPLDTCLPELEDFSTSFTDSFLDFDFIDRWLVQENPDLSGTPNMSDLGANTDSLVLPEGRFEKSDDAFSEEANNEAGLAIGGSDRELGYLGSLVEEHLGKVSLDGVSKGEKGSDLVNHGADCPVPHNTMGNGGSNMKTSETVSDGEKGERDNSADESEGESSSSSTSTSSSSSDSEDEKEEEDGKSGKKIKNKEGVAETTNDVEEGEITMSDADEMVAWSDDDEEAGECAVSGPIRSKNEIQVLPPVPSVNVTLEPHHQIQPVGTILSMIGAQVIVEGVEKHNPLNEGSILWITETRLPLGIVDEIFGPVKNPYYIVRYNSESEVPADIQQGTTISFVPEFASHVLNDKNLYHKGYDASNENDEELSEEVEFSDDEKEAEYRRMLKMKKRGGTSDTSKPGPTRNNRKQRKNQCKNWNRNQDSEAKTLEDQQNHTSSSSGLGLNFPCNQTQTMVAQIPQGVQAPSSSALTGSWPINPPQLSTPPPPSVSLPGGLSPNGMLWMQQNSPFPMYQTPLQTNPMFPGQNPIPGLPLNFNTLGGQINSGNVPPIPTWSSGFDPNLLNLLQFQIGLQTQNASMLSHMGGQQLVQPQGGQNIQHMQAPPEISPQNFNQGRGGGGGHHRGRGRAAGAGRGWHHR